jgi:prepilin-type N-terminal cleavage/methylation domain-containing protein
MTSARGFTLIELLIAMAIMTTVGAALVSLIVAGESIASAQPEAADQQQRARIAVQALTADIARAGTGVDRGPQAGPLGRYFPAIEPSADGGITIWYVSSRAAQTTLSAPLARGAPTAAVDDPSAFTAGSTALVFDAHGCRDVLRVDDVAGAVLLLGGSLRSCDYAPGTAIAQGEVRTYHLDPVARQLLRRDEATGGSVPLLDQVTGMSVAYLDSGRRVRISVRVATAAPRPRVPDLGIVFDVSVPNLWLS